MLSVEQCQKYLKQSKYSKEEIKEIRNSIYRLAEILVDGYLSNKENSYKTDQVGRKIQTR